ncbi:hypothetical protein QWY14_12735 [Planococcus sp. N028]|uniref:Uncharacterized protein n=1 Tax=Planococcus shixiaomingii TaxID=3058393 RepID=A0ABT8N463_9BACL|nr:MULTISPECIES: hypothetical protein [unclassified Planococcus (in: firmicutes)]MDN7242672.1 hypothetical protein [Planococcus sp. N028]WKA55698.1 hypothetical protein QWY21_04720 [Planococcus sp. N022]
MTTKVNLIPLTREGNWNITRKKPSYQIVEELKSKGIQAEICKRLQR